VLGRLTESKAGRGGVIAVATVAMLIALFVVFRSVSGDDNKMADEKEVRAAAQKQIEVLQKENISPALKAEMIAHQQGLLQPSSHGPNGPPKGAP
jgi:uncharacterized protein (UPF0147 family)